MRRLTDLMSQVGHLLERHVDHAVEPVGLALRQLLALAHLAWHPGLIPYEGIRCQASLRAVVERLRTTRRWTPVCSPRARAGSHPIREASMAWG